MKIKSAFYSYGCYAFLLFLTSCSTVSPSGRILSKEELKKYNLNGVLREAELCPNRFDEKLNRLVVDGPCQLIDCSVVNGKTVCQAKPK
ncbi:MAG: hypothetical protein ACXVCP_05640 [Bdellovibrio sp.]